MSRDKLGAKAKAKEPEVDRLGIVEEAPAPAAEDGPVVVRVWTDDDGQAWRHVRHGERDYTERC